MPDDMNPTSEFMSSRTARQRLLFEGGENMKPIKKFKQRGITASIWRNLKKGDGSVFHSISLERRYKDTDGTWKSAYSFSEDDAPLAIFLLVRAWNYIGSLRDEEAS